MAVYKVHQDVESDDKLIGPFTFKQFVFILIAFALMWGAWVMTKVSPILGVLPLPFILAFLVLGLPLRKEQPTDVYVAALINFWLKPKVRIWGQDGMIEHVRITAPKKVQQFYSDGLSSQEVQSKLNRIAKTLDTRGWAVKNVGVDEVAGLTGGYGSTDRLVNSSLQAQTIAADVTIEDDVLDPENTATAHRFAELEAKAAGHDIHVAPKAALEHQQGAQNAAPGSVVIPTVSAEVQPQGPVYNAQGERVVTIDDSAPLQATGHRDQSIHQRVVSPDRQGGDPQNNQNDSQAQATTPYSADTIEPLINEGASQAAPTDADLDQGGEISLR